MEASTEVKVIEDISEENAPAIYVKGGLQKFLDAVTAEVVSEVPDLTTKKGRDRIASLAAKVSKSKVAVEKPGREYLARLKEMPKVVEAELRDFVRAMDTLRDETRAPLTAWEEAEAARVAHHQANIDYMKLRLECRDLDAAELKENIATLEGTIIGEHWEEFEAEASRTKDKALTALREALVIREKHEAELAEIAKFQAEQTAREQKEREERIAREAAEAERLAAEQRAQAERDAVAQRERGAQAAAERRELELKLQAEQAERQAAQAERDRIAAEQRAEQERADAVRRQAEAVERAEQAERQRQADEAARLEAEAKAREADKAHKAKINREAVAAFVAGGMTEEAAKQAVTLIAKRQIPSIAISY